MSGPVPLNVHGRKKLPDVLSGFFEILLNPSEMEFRWGLDYRAEISACISQIHSFNGEAQLQRSMYRAKSTASTVTRRVT